MASRFTDTEIWNEDWFCEMPGEYQLFVKYVFDKCDNAGVWKPNKFDFETKTKFKVSLDLLFKRMNTGGGGQQRVLLLENGRWFITGYLLFQWFNKKKTFDLVLSNRLHKSLYDIAIENKIPLIKIRGLREVLKTSMVMEVVNEVDKGGPGEKTIDPPPERKWSTTPGEDFFDLELPEITEGAVIQHFKITKRKDVTRFQVQGLWGVFKAQNFNRKKFYQYPSDAFSHFLNWSVKQEITQAAAKQQVDSSSLDHLKEIHKKKNGSN